MRPPADFVEARLPLDCTGERSLSAQAPSGFVALPYSPHLAEGEPESGYAVATSCRKGGDQDESKTAHSIASTLRDHAENLARSAGARPRKTPQDFC
jgi:hypothetical protein